MTVRNAALQQTETLIRQLAEISVLTAGIGGKTAELIVDRFGADTLHVLENEPERLLEIRASARQSWRRSLPPITRAEPFVI